jgi:hypothetical protein
MAEVNRSIPQIPTVRITIAAHVLAQFRAWQAVKDQLRKQGLKVSHYAAREITVLAQEYLSGHRSELMPDAIAAIERMTLAGEFGKRAQRALAASRAVHKTTEV